MNTLEVRNRMSAKALKEEMNSSIQFIRNPKTGKIFFTCGSITGYVSPKVKDNLDSIEIQDLLFAECRKPGDNQWVPCIMMKGANNVVKEL